MVNAYIVYTRSRNMEATLRGNFLTIFHTSSIGYYMQCTYYIQKYGLLELLEEITKLQFTLVVLVTTYMELSRSRNMEATFRRNHIDTLYVNVLHI